jgi:ubiquinone/menaquinone biosynthesis C-methylase UbiE
MSTKTIYLRTVDIIRERLPKATGAYLDIGSGSGELIALVKKSFGVEARACDYTDTLMKLEGQKVDIANLNTEPLPYADGQFGLVTCTEVIEHLEHCRETIRDIHRVAADGALVVFSTPNILNIKSRIRFLTFGFWNLFGPLHMKESRLYSTGGHINPISYFYIAHALYDAGFREVRVTVDKYQRSAFFYYLMLILPIRFFSGRALKREETKYKTIDALNREVVVAMNSKDLLLGRTVIVSAIK